MSRPRPHRRDDYAAEIAIDARWRDNDVFGHVNNVVYYEYVDTAVNRWLIDAGLLDFRAGEIVGLVVETGCVFFSAIAFPDRVIAGVRVAHIGRSSVRYEVGLFRNNDGEASAQAHFTHVYVDRASHRPTPLPERWRETLARLRVGETTEQS